MSDFGRWPPLVGLGIFPGQGELFDFEIFHSDTITEKDWTSDRHCPFKELSSYFVLNN